MRGVVTAVVALALAAAAPSARADIVLPAEGSWAGTSSAGLPVHFGVAGNRVVNTRFKFRWGFCGTFESHDPVASLEIDASGHWAFEDPRGQTLEGTFVAPDRVEGKVLSVGRQLPGCPATEATFTASPVPPNPESLAAARAGIEALPYAIRLRQPQRPPSTLIGLVAGARGERFRFFLFVNRSAARRIPGEPAYRFDEGPHGLEGGPLARTDAFLNTPPKRGETRAQRRERGRILAAVKDTVCLRQTGSRCPRSR